MDHLLSREKNRRQSASDSQVDPTHSHSFVVDGRLLSKRPRWGRLGISSLISVGFHRHLRWFDVGDRKRCSCVRYSDTYSCSLVRCCSCLLAARGRLDGLRQGPRPVRWTESTMSSRDGSFGLPATAEKASIPSVRGKVISRPFLLGRAFFSETQSPDVIAGALPGGRQRIRTSDLHNVNVTL